MQVGTVPIGSLYCVHLTFINYAHVSKMWYGNSTTTVCSTLHDFLLTEHNEVVVCRGVCRM